MSLDVLESVSGGEGGIRTPDSLATMPDFESGAFNRALPPLRDQVNDLTQLAQFTIALSARKFMLATLNLSGSANSNGTH